MRNSFVPDLGNRAKRLVRGLIPGDEATTPADVLEDCRVASGIFSVGMTRRSSGLKFSEMSLLDVVDERERIRFLIVSKLLVGTTFTQKKIVVLIFYKGATLKEVAWRLVLTRDEIFANLEALQAKMHENLLKMKEAPSTSQVQ